MGSQQPIVHFLWILLCDGSALKELPFHSNRRQWNAVGTAIVFQCVQRGLRNGAVQKPDMELFPGVVEKDRGQHGFERGDIILVKGDQKMNACRFHRLRFSMDRMPLGACPSVEKSTSGRG